MHVAARQKNGYYELLSHFLPGPYSVGETCMPSGIEAVEGNRRDLVGELATEDEVLLEAPNRRATHISMSARSGMFISGKFVNGGTGVPGGLT